MGGVSVAGRIGRIVYGLCLLLIGLALAAGGARLISLGGSPYYIAAGLAATAAGIAALLGRWRLAGWIYLTLMAVTLVWALAEAGLNGWALMPRLLSPFILGLPLLVLAFTRGGRADRLAAGGAGIVALGLVVAVWTNAGFSPVAAAGRTAAPIADAADDWRHFGNSPGGDFHSPLTQITPENVGKLRIAWQHPMGPIPAMPLSQNQTVPLNIGDSLYLCNAFGDVFALDAETGKQRWSFEAKADVSGMYTTKCRGVAYYEVPQATGTCSRRVYTHGTGGFLTALDAATGAICTDFGENGRVNLISGIKQRRTGYYRVTSAPTVIDGKLVLGGAVADGQHVDEPSGVIRAFDAVTGKLAWAWDLGRPDWRGEPAEGEFYTPGTPNAWGPMSADEELGLVYLPTGNATPDYWGKHRTPESNEYASSVVALDVRTGDPRWHFQTVHYDVWDYDVASQPVLFDLRRDGRSIPAIMINTKRGQIFVLDRRNGAPLFPIVEKPAPQRGAVEKLAPTQPWSTGLPDIGYSDLRERSMWGVTALDQLWCRIRFREARYDGSFTPPGVTPSIVDPGYTGGVNWGSAAIDPGRQLGFFLTNRLVNYIRLVPREDPAARDLKADPTAELGGLVAQEGTPYAADIKPFVSPIGVPCQQPPHGLINVIDLRTGKLLWERPIGSARDQGPMMTPSRLPFTLGTITFGGTMSTATGLVFAGGSQDHAFRAFDSETGKLLFEADLPGSAATRPMSFRSARTGRQYIVVASDAPYKDGKAHGAITAFALPEK